MAKFKITKSTTVAELKEQFRSEVGGVLRVYEGRSEAPDDTALVSLGAKEGDLECRTSRTVGKFIEAFQSELGLKVKVYTKDNWVSVLDGITLATVREIPKSARKAQMEQFLAYQRDEKEEVETAVNEETSNSEEMDVNDGWDASEALASETKSAAAAFHKLGDGFESEDDAIGYFEDSFIFIEEDGDYKVYRYPNEDEIEDIKEAFNNGATVYYRIMNESVTSEETEDIVMDNHEWGCEDYSLDDAMYDVLSGAKEYEWPPIPIDFIYNGKIFYSFNLAD